MLRFLFVATLTVALSSQTLMAQRADTLQVAIADSMLRDFAAKVGPAEGVVSFFGPPAYRFAVGTYAMPDPTFPLRYSPDSLVRYPMQQFDRRRRVARTVRLATIVPLAVLSYSAIRIVLLLGAVVTNQRTDIDHVRTLLPISGVASVVGVGLSGTFDIAALMSVRRSVKRHNRLFGRKAPTLFNPRGL